MYGWVETERLLTGYRSLSGTFPHRVLIVVLCRGLGKRYNHDTYRSRPLGLRFGFALAFVVRTAAAAANRVQPIYCVLNLIRLHTFPQVLVKERDDLKKSQEEYRREILRLQHKLDDLQNNRCSNIYEDIDELVKRNYLASKGGSANSSGKKTWSCIYAFKLVLYSLKCVAQEGHLTLGYTTRGQFVTLLWVIVVSSHHHT